MICSNRIRALRDNPTIEVAAPRVQCATSRQILDLFGERSTITDISAEGLSEPGSSGADREYNYFLAEDVMDGDHKKLVLRSTAHIDSDAIEKILRVAPEKLDVYRLVPMLAGALALDRVKEERGRDEDPTLDGNDGLGRSSQGAASRRSAHARIGAQSVDKLLFRPETLRFGPCWSLQTQQKTQR